MVMDTTLFSMVDTTSVRVAPPSVCTEEEGAPVDWYTTVLPRLPGQSRLVKALPPMPNTRATAATTARAPIFLPAPDFFLGGLGAAAAAPV